MARHTLLRSTARRLLTKAQSVPFAQIEKAEWKFYIDYIQPGMTVLDVGANIGELTLLFAHFARQEGRVHSFEPTPSTYARLKALTLSHSNVTVVQKAVTDHSGTAALHIYDEEHSSWNTLADRSLEQYGIGSTNVMTAEVITTTVDDYCRDNLIEQVHLLKIDVEGAEYQVLQGAERMLSDSRILCVSFEYGETTLDMGNNIDEIRRYLGRHGYKLSNLFGRRPLFPGGWKSRRPHFAMLVARPH